MTVAGGSLARARNMPREHPTARLPISFFFGIKLFYELCQLHRIILTSKIPAATRPDLDANVLFAISPHPCTCLSTIQILLVGLALPIDRLIDADELEDCARMNVRSFPMD